MISGFALSIKQEGECKETEIKWGIRGFWLLGI